MDDRRVGLRLYEVESAFGAVLSATSPGLRHFKRTRLMGQALRLAQLIRGMDVIDNPDRLEAIAAAQLRIDPMQFENVLETLEAVDLIKRRQGKIHENVRLMDFGENYERVGSFWMQGRPDSREIMTVEALDELVDTPKHVSEIAAFSGAGKPERALVLEVTRNANLLQPISVGTGDPVLFAPMLWDVDPERFERALTQMKTSSIAQVVRSVQQQHAGAELDLMHLSDAERALANRAITVGLLPTIPVNSAGGEKSFSFVPYSGALITGPAEREILDRARAVVACVRYGERHAVASRIVHPIALVRALLDQSRGYALGWHSEIKDQYAPLVARGVGRIEKHGSRYRFRLIPSDENLRAVRLALELIKHGQVIEERAPLDSAHHAALLTPGGVGSDFDGIRIANSQRKATDDELEELVESARY